MEEFTQIVSRRMPLRQPLDPPDPSRPNISLFLSKTFSFMKQYTFESKVTNSLFSQTNALSSLLNCSSPSIQDWQLKS